MRKWSLVVVAVVVGTFAVAAVVLLWPAGTDPISEDEAVASFRQNAGEPDRGEPDAGEVPEAGVYSYATVGSESVKLGPLPAETREYPGLTTATVAAGDEGCFELGLNLIEQHTEDTTWCRTDDGGLRLGSLLKHQSVAQFDTTVTIGCDPGVVWRPGADGLPMECSLSLGGGPMEVTADFAGTSISSSGTQEVEGETIEVVKLDMHFDLTGSVSGTWDERLWVTTDTAMPVRIDREFHLEGFAAFDEDFSLQIESTSPRR